MKKIEALDVSKKDFEGPYITEIYQKYANRGYINISEQLFKNCADESKDFVRLTFEEV